MSKIQDHPLRYTLSNELHARPFPALEPPCFAAHLAIKEPRAAAVRDREQDRAHLSSLLDRFGAVVSRDNLSRTGWPTGAPGRNALDVHMLRLRRRIGPLGLAIRTVRSRGYLLEAGELQMVQPA